MTKEITQEERLDLKREQVKEEMQAYDSKFSDWCEVFGFDQKKLMEEYYHDIVIKSDEYKKLEEQNASLQSELDKAIHQLKDYEKVLKDYADEYNYAYIDNGFAFYSNNYSNEGLAQETLEKWEVK